SVILATKNVGLPFTSRKIRDKYSPIIPSEIICTAPTSRIKHAVLAHPCGGACLISNNFAVITQTPSTIATNALSNPNRVTIRSGSDENETNPSAARFFNPRNVYEGFPANRAGLSYSTPVCRNPTHVRN